jgi:hypothetical protein
MAIPTDEKRALVWDPVTESSRQEVVDHVDLDNIGTTTHAQIDTQLTSLALISRGMTIECPEDTDNFTLFYTDVGITVQQINFILQGTTNATVFVRFDANRSLAGTSVINAGTVVTNTTTGQEITSFDNAVIPPANWVWVEVTALTDNPDTVHVSVVFN